MKKLMPENYLYWVKKGYSEEDAKNEANRRKGGRYAGNKNYYLLKNNNLTEEEAIRLAEKWKSDKCGLKRENMVKNKFNGDEEEYIKWKLKNCNLSKENLLKIMSETEYTEYKRNLGLKLDGKRPTSTEYWINKGYSQKEAKGKVKEHGIYHSIRRPEYWMKKGYSLSESIELVSKSQSLSSLDAFIKRYGKDDGLVRYNNFKYGQHLKSKRSIIHWLNQGYSEKESIDKVSEYQSKISGLQPKLPQYWLNRGYSEKESIRKSKNFARTMCLWSVEYWLDKGYNDIDAKKEVSKIQKQNSLKAIESFKHPGRIVRSKLEDNVCDYFINNNIEFQTDYVVNDIENKRVYFPDLTFDKFIIEVYGDFWHGNPNLYNPDSKIIGEITVKDKHKQDKERIDRLSILTNKKVYIWWESEIIEKGLDYLYFNILEKN